MNVHELKDMLNSAYGVNSTYGYMSNLSQTARNYIENDTESARVLYEKILEARKAEKRIAEKRFTIKRVIFNDPATVVYWNDGTKTVVKASGEQFDREKGLAMAFVKRMCGNGGNYNNIFHKWCGEEK